MDFVYRLPSLAFDPSEKTEVQANYPKLLKLIHLSSPDFYARIKDVPYEKLSNKELLTLHKYLLRGRYRPVPFGLWAGVGLGSFGEVSAFSEVKTNFVISHNEEILLNNKINALSKERLYKGKYSINSSASLVGNHVYFWSKDRKTYKWKENRLDSNPVFQKVVQYLHQHAYLDFQEFKKWFANVPLRIIRQLWKSVIASKLIILKQRSTSKCKSFVNDDFINVDVKQHLDEGNMVDLHLSHRLSQSYTVQQSLSMLNDEIGNLVYKPKSLYTESFKQSFYQEHDDRFVALSEVMKPYTELSAHFKSKKWNYQQEIKPKGFAHLSSFIKTAKPGATVDLSKKLKKKSLAIAPETTVLYRLGPHDSLVLDNVTCGRTLALGGRFTLDDDKLQFYKGIASSSLSNSSIIYADVKFDESPLVNSLASHINCVQYSIHVTDNVFGQNSIPLHSIFIGISDGRVVLYWKDMKKEIIPIIQHAVDPRHITHPLGRLMWEIAHQDRARLVTDTYKPSVDTPYLPQLNWRNLILSPASWLIQERDTLTHKTFLEVMKKYNMPDRVLIGDGDQELLIDTRCRKSMEIFYHEVRKKGSMIVRDCQWIHNESFQNSNGQSLYPQFSTSLSQKDFNYSSVKLFFNPKGKPDPDWLSFKIRMLPDDVIFFLQDTWLDLIEREEGSDRISKWYYLAFEDDCYHIKLRIKVGKEAKNDCSQQFLHLLSKLPMVKSVELQDYFPEPIKYGHGTRHISESIFYLESQYAAGIGDKPSMFNCNYEELFTLLVGLGSELITKSGRALEWKRRYQSEVIGKHGKLDRVRQSEFYRDFVADKIIPERFESLIAHYMRLIEQHEYWDQEEKVFTLIENHIHMFINRIFPENPQAVEHLIWSGIFKKVNEFINIPVIAGYLED
ncbi:thiopeptide-type bacteriocin biosynthesis protein [Litoribacter alkaliphilus]|uniref:Thiopeptide-type bacteriocin biosynthesis protein n=1 Tax=Litoribacter ruber TaxID=702568 RepID=A0AAP2CKN9_9BACT|nr:thiopeptide-type bacteriocin biosynthesis protein [Litoribacter alkaliphilus]MBS9525700.1 thiopeptide-type bacteriocin biosynthesis protein [Litoribacter alkaliphilus]